jgi:hypothetical protein
LADTKKVEISWGKISTLFSKIGVQIEGLEGLDIFPKEVTANIKKANEALTSYQTKLDAIRKS